MTQESQTALSGRSDGACANGLAPAAGAYKLARSMLLRAFLAQNVAIGCLYGGFSVSVLALQERFHSSRGTASMGLSLVVLLAGLVGPVVTTLIARCGCE